MAKAAGSSESRAADALGATASSAKSASEAHELPYASELKRKAVHLIALVIPLGMWLVPEATALILLLVVSLIAVAADVARVRSAAFARFIFRTFGFMMRAEECPAVGGRVVFNGATWVLLSSTLLLAVFPVDVAIAAFTAFMIADAAAAVVGRRWGRHRWGRTTRTAEGTAAFLVASVLVMLPFGWFPPWIAVLASLAGATAEIPSRPLNDNIRVPLVMAAFLYFSRLLAGG